MYIIYIGIFYDQSGEGRYARREVSMVVTKCYSKKQVGEKRV